MRKFVSWYRQPRINAPVEYLALMPATEQDEGGYFYTLKLENAHRFDTYEEALKPTPGYDGSANIDARTGVFAVFACDDEIVEHDPWLVPTLLFIAVVIAYFVWQFFIRHN